MHAFHSLRALDTKPVKKQPERRRGGRLCCTYMTCPLGKVVDLSSTGVRIRAKRNAGVEVGKHLCLTLESFGQAVNLCAKPVWAKRRGFRQFEMGFCFEQMTPQLRASLLELARLSADAELIRPRCTA